MATMQIAPILILAATIVNPVLLLNTVESSINDLRLGYADFSALSRRLDHKLDITPCNDKKLVCKLEATANAVDNSV